MRTKLLSLILFIAIGALHGVIHSTEPETKVRFALRGEGYLNISDGNDGKIARPFLVSQNSNNIPSINLFLSSLNIQSGQWQGEISGILGTYVDQNLAGEIGPFRNIGSLWLAHKPKDDIEILIGVYPSHIGLESPISMECITPTRSIVADNTPYYQSGIRMRYEIGTDAFALHLLNGWQKSSIDKNGIIPAFGYEYVKTHEDMNLRISGFLGSTSHDESESIRYHQHIGATYQANARLSLAGSLDFGYQQKKNVHTWVIAPLLMAQWAVSESFKLNGRLEYYHDPKGMIINNESGLSAIGFSIGVDWKANHNLLLRSEYRSIREMRDVMNGKYDNPILGLHLQWFIAKDLM